MTSLCFDQVKYFWTFFFKFFYIYLFIYVCLCVHARVSVRALRTTHACSSRPVWRLEDIFRVSLLFFHHVGPGDKTHVFRLGGSLLVLPRIIPPVPVYFVWAPTLLDSLLCPFTVYLMKLALALASFHLLLFSLPCSCFLGFRAHHCLVYLISLWFFFKFDVRIHSCKLFELPLRYPNGSDKLCFHFMTLGI